MSSGSGSPQYELNLLLWICSVTLSKQCYINPLWVRFISWHYIRLVQQVYQGCSPKLTYWLASYNKQKVLCSWVNLHRTVWNTIYRVLSDKWMAPFIFFPSCVLYNQKPAIPGLKKSCDVVEYILCSSEIVWCKHLNSWLGVNLCKYVNNLLEWSQILTINVYHGSMPIWLSNDLIPYCYCFNYIFRQNS